MPARATRLRCDGSTKTSRAALLRRHWPELLRLVRDVYGAEAALKLAEAFGGRYIYLPQRATGDHPIAKALGATGIGVLGLLISKHEPLARIVIPKANGLLTDDRPAQAKALRARGLTVSEIAARMGRHVRTIHNYLRLARERGL